jgi:hypothetical protein
MTLEKLFKLYFKKGRGVHNDSIETQTFGKTIVAFDELYKEIALDSDKGENRGDIRGLIRDKDKKFNLAATEFFLPKTVTFSAYIKPIYIDLFATEETEKAAKKLFSLFEDSTNQDKLRTNYTRYSDFTLKAYRAFLVEVAALDVKLQIAWTDDNDVNYFSKDFARFTANNIIGYIDGISDVNRDNITAEGKFVSINCIGLKFTLLDDDKGQFNGFFAKNLKDTLPTLNFTNTYSIEMNRSVTKVAGKNKPIDKNTIIQIVPI